MVRKWSSYGTKLLSRKQESAYLARFRRLLSDVKVQGVSIPVCTEHSDKKVVSNSDLSPQKILADIPKGTDGCPSSDEGYYAAHFFHESQLSDFDVENG